MENVTNLASSATAAASKMIWGDKTTEHNETGGKEPISGQQGKGTIDEPYDQGNKANPTEVPVDYTSGNPTVTADKPSKTSYSGNGTQENPISFDEDTSTNTKASRDLPFTDKKATFTGNPETSSDKTPLFDDKSTSSIDKNTSLTEAKDTSSTDKDTSLTDDKLTYSSDHPTTSNDGSTPPRTSKTTENLTAGGLPGTGNDSSMPGVVNKLPTNATGSSMSNPADAAGQSGAAPPGPTSSDTSAAKDHEGAEKPTDEPKGQQENAIKESTLSAEELMKRRDPNDHSGEPMHMHDGGDKGIADGQDKGDTSSKESMPGMSHVPSTQEERRDSKIGMPGGQEHGKEYGTGDKWEKTTGLAAEGGDFDATKPGAGREADRLMAEKGIQKTAPGEHPTPSGPDHDTKEKVPLSQKIKDKLHIGSHH